jgi:predicted protein tyrosine phosphatase
MKRVFVVSKPGFNALMESNDINDDNVEEKGHNVALISINDTIGDWMKPWFNEDHSNVIRFWFDDVSSDLEISPTNRQKCRAFTIEDGKRMLEFINRNKEKSFIVHCAAGISRSGAVGQFITNYFEYDQQLFEQTNPYIHPNSHILRILNNLAWGK